MNILTDKCFKVTSQFYDYSDEGHHGAGWQDVESFTMTGMELLGYAAMHTINGDREVSYSVEWAKPNKNRVPSLYYLRELALWALGEAEKKNPLEWRNL